MSANESSGVLAPQPGAPRLVPPLSAEQKLSGDMLLLCSAFMGLASVLWLAIYWGMGYRFSTAIPLAFQAVSAVTIILYLRTRRLDVFAVIQLGLNLFTPFAMQFAIGNFVNSSGVSLWGVLAPVGAITVLGTRNSIPWFFGWFFMTVMAGTFDFLLAPNATAVNLQVVSLFFVLNFTCIAAMIYALLWFFAAEKQRLRGLVDSSLAEVAAEKERSERLLLNILPPAIAERLKRNEVNIAQGHADVTVLFADIVNFTQISEELSAADTVKMLNEVFTLFDDLAERHGVEKIKTMGDGYMAAGGLVSGSSVHFADEVAHMALDMVDALAAYRQRTGERIEIRVGIGTGPVMAGVIGKKKFIYDMWGDTVNVAFRMSGEASPGGVQVDPATYRRLQARFVFDAASDVDVKGKGRMQVYRLRSRLDAPALARSAVA